LPLTPTPDAPFRARPPAVETAEPSVPLVHSSELDNGMTVIVVERPDLPLVSLEVVNRDAHDDNTRSERGLAAFTARLLNEGTLLENGEVWRHLRINGVLPWRGATPEATYVGITVPAAGVDQGVGILSALVRRPVFDEQALELAQVDMSNAIFDQAVHGEHELKDLALTALAGPDHPAVDAPLGSGENVVRFSAAAVKRFHDQHYAPEKAALVVVGAVDTAEAFELARRHFGAWPARNRSAGPAPAALEYVQERAKIQGLYGWKDEAYFALALPCPAASDPEGVDADLLGMVLANLTLSRSRRTLRHDQGVTYGVHASCERHPGYGVFWIQFGVEPDQAGTALTAVLAEVARLRETPVSPSELARAKSRYLAGLAEELSTNRGAAGLLAHFYAQGLPLDELTRLVEGVQAASAENLQRTATLFFNGRVGIAVGGLPRLLEPELARFGGGQWWGVRENFSPAR
jgi:zinc protease